MNNFYDDNDTQSLMTFSDSIGHAIYNMTTDADGITSFGSENVRRRMPWTENYGTALSSLK